jgi:hypothetical protein
VIVAPKLGENDGGRIGIGLIGVAQKMEIFAGKMMTEFVKP